MTSRVGTGRAYQRLAQFGLNLHERRAVHSDIMKRERLVLAALVRVTADTRTV